MPTPPRCRAGWWSLVPAFLSFLLSRGGSSGGAVRRLNSACAVRPRWVCVRCGGDGRACLGASLAFRGARRPLGGGLPCSCCRVAGRRPLGSSSVPALSARALLGGGGRCATTPGARLRCPIEGNGDAEPPLPLDCITTRQK